MEVEKEDKKEELELTGAVEKDKYGQEMGWKVYMKG